MSREIYLSFVVGHLGDCVQVGQRYEPDFGKFLPIFRNVRTRWYWPFNVAYGSEFPGEISLLEVHAPTPANLRSDKPRRVSKVRVGDDISHVRAQRYVGPAKSPTVVRRTKDITEAEMRYAERPSPSVSDPYTSAAPAPLWREEPKPWRSGGGGDFAGAGASSSWDDAPAKASVRFAADTNYEPQVTVTDAPQESFRASEISEENRSSWDSGSTSSSYTSSSDSSSDSGSSDS